jgi:hypothetical protein
MKLPELPRRIPVRGRVELRKPSMRRTFGADGAARAIPVGGKGRGNARRADQCERNQAGTAGYSALSSRAVWGHLNASVKRAPARPSKEARVEDDRKPSRGGRRALRQRHDVNVPAPHPEFRRWTNQSRADVTRSRPPLPQVLQTDRPESLRTLRQIDAARQQRTQQSMLGAIEMSEPWATSYIRRYRAELLASRENTPIAMRSLCPRTTGWEGAAPE